MKVENWIFGKIYFVSDQRMSKNVFFSVFQVCTKTLRNLTVWHWWCSNSQKNRRSRLKTCCNGKSRIVKGESCVSFQKTFKKWVFLGFSISALKSFGILLHAFSDNQIHIKTDPLEAPGIATLKKATLGEQIAFQDKKLQKRCFQNFQTVHH